MLFIVMVVDAVNVHIVSHTVNNELILELQIKACMQNTDFNRQCTDFLDIYIIPVLVNNNIGKKMLILFTDYRFVY